MSDLSNAVKPGDILNLEGYFKFDWKKPFWAWAERRAIDAIVADQKYVFNKTLKSKTMLTRDNHSTMYLGDNKIFSQEPPCATVIPISDYENDKNRIITIYRLNPTYIGRELKDDDIALLIESCNIMAQRKVPYDIARDVQDGINDLTDRPWDSSLNILDTQCNMSEDPNIISSAVCSQAQAINFIHWRHKKQAATGEIIRPLWQNLNPMAWTKKQIEEYPHYWDTAICHPANFATTNECFCGEFVRIGRFKNGKSII